jgi:hypothetical protein
MRLNLILKLNDYSINLNQIQIHEENFYHIFQLNYFMKLYFE